MIQEGASPWRPWTCDSRFRVWEVIHTGDCGHETPGAGLGGAQPGDCGHVTPGVGSWRWGHLGVWTCAQGAGYGRGFRLETVAM